MQAILPSCCQPSETAFPERKLAWIVFGGTGHMGQSLVKSALIHGDDVMMVGKPGEMSAEALHSLARRSWTAADAMLTKYPGPGPRPKTGRIEAAQCDVRYRKPIDDVVAQTLEAFGRIDVVANCAGYGVVGSCEDQSEIEVRDQFQTNFMGTLYILQATLPIFRRQQREAIKARDAAEADAADAAESADNNADDTDTDDLPNGGRYLIFSSTSGALGVPGLGPYCATKYAVEGLIEAMLYEVDAFDIKATLVEPGLVRRNDPRGAQVQGVNDVKTEGQQNSQQSQQGSHNNPNNQNSQNNPRGAVGGLPTWGHFLINQSSPPYDAATSPALHTMRMVQWLGDRQPTAVVPCAEICWQLVHCKSPPVRLPLGSYAIESIRDRVRSVTEELEDWQHLNFPRPPDASAVPDAAAGGTVGAGRTMRPEGRGSAAVDDDDDEMAD